MTISERRAIRLLQLLRGGEHWVLVSLLPAHDLVSILGSMLGDGLNCDLLPWQGSLPTPTEPTVWSVAVVAWPRLTTKLDDLADGLSLSAEVREQLRTTGTCGLLSAEIPVEDNERFLAEMFLAVQGYIFDALKRS